MAMSLEAVFVFVAGGSLFGFRARVAIGTRYSR